MGVKAKRCLDIRVAEKPLNRLDIRPLVDQPACQPAAKVVKAEPLPLLELHLAAIAARRRWSTAHADEADGHRGIYRRLNTSKPAPEHRAYSYLLRGPAITRPNQIWALDISVPQEAA